MNSTKGVPNQLLVASMVPIDSFMMKYALAVVMLLLRIVIVPVADPVA